MEARALYHIVGESRLMLGKSKRCESRIRKELSNNSCAKIQGHAQRWQIKALVQTPNGFTVGIIDSDP